MAVAVALPRHILSGRSRSDAIDILKQGQKRDGDFVTRLSGSEPGNVVVSCIFQGEYFHFVLKKEARGYVYANEVRGQDLGQCLLNLRSKSPVTTPDFRQFWLANRYGKNGDVQPGADRSPKKKSWGLFGKKKKSTADLQQAQPQAPSNAGAPPPANTPAQSPPQGNTFDPFAAMPQAATTNDPYVGRFLLRLALSAGHQQPMPGTHRLSCANRGLCQQQACIA